MLWGFFKKMVIGRWHISLSSWFRDYVYIPLGGSKAGRLKAVRNTFIIFLLSGFWHGANWTYIVWGGIHALGFLPLLLLGTHRKHSKEIVAADRRYPSFREWISMTVTFAFVTLDWHFRKHERDLNIAPGRYKYARYAFYTLMLYISIAHSGSGSSFIYFQF